jgi:predicted secreted protein
MKELSFKAEGNPNREAKIGPTRRVKMEKDRRADGATWPLEKRINNAASLVPNPITEMGSNSTIMTTGSSRARDERLMGKPSAKAQKYARMAVTSQARKE